MRRNNLSCIRRVHQWLLSHIFLPSMKLMKELVSLLNFLVIYSSQFFTLKFYIYPESCIPHLFLFQVSIKSYNLNLSSLFSLKKNSTKYLYILSFFILLLCFSKSLFCYRPSEIHWFSSSYISLSLSLRRKWVK